MLMKMSKIYRFITEKKPQKPESFVEKMQNHMLIYIYIYVYTLTHTHPQKGSFFTEFPANVDGNVENTGFPANVDGKVENSSIYHGKKGPKNQNHTLKKSQGSLQMLMEMSKIYRFITGKKPQKPIIIC